MQYYPSRNLQQELLATNVVEVSAETMHDDDGRTCLAGLVRRVSRCGLGETATQGDNGGQGLAALPEWKAWQNLWKRNDTKANVPAVKKNIEIALGNGLKLTIKKDGAVAFAGIVNGTKVSGSSQLVWAGSDGSAAPPYLVTLYVPPKAGVFDGYSACLRLAWRDGEFKVEE